MNEENEPEKSRKEPNFQIKVDWGGKSIEEMVKLFLSINNLHVSLGGSGIRINCLEEYTIKEVNESKYDLFKGTTFSNTQVVRKPDEFMEYVNRAEVYSVADNLAEQNHAERIKKMLDEKYPTRSFGDKVPKTDATFFLYNSLVNER